MSYHSPTMSMVSVNQYRDGRADIKVIGPGGTLTLLVNTNEPSMAIRDPERGEMQSKAAFQLIANDQLMGWFIARKGDTPAEDTLVWFPAEVSLHLNIERKPKKPPRKKL